MTTDSLEVMELLEADAEFRQLFAAHHELERRLHALSDKHYLTGPEEIEESRLKKQKLHLKDRMAEILRRHRHPESTPAAAGQTAHPQPQG